MQRRLKQIDESVARYLHQLDSVGRQEPSPALHSRIDRLQEKIVKLREEMQRLKALEVQMLDTPDRQISLTGPDARSMGGSGVAGDNVQAAVETGHHPIVAHDAVRTGNDTSQLAPMADKAKAALETETLDVVADRGTFNSGQILKCDRAGVTVTLPKPLAGFFRRAGGGRHRCRRRRGGAEGAGADVPVRRVGGDGQVRLAGRGQLAADGRIVFDLAGRLQPGDYTVLAALYLNGNTVSAEIRRIPYRAK